MTTALVSKLQEADPRVILARYLSDESTNTIAQSYGVTRQALGQFLIKHAEAEWREAQVARAVAKREAADDEFESIQAAIQSADKDERERLQLRLSLARERMRSAQWELERTLRRIYGQDQPADLSGKVSITLNIGGENATNAVQHEVSGKSAVIDVA